MRRQAERLSEQARRKGMYGHPSSMFVRPLTVHSVYERLEALGHDQRDIKWEHDPDWDKLFTEGGEINETCMYSSSSPRWPLLTILLSDWRRASLPSLEREITNRKESRLADELCQRLALRYTELLMFLPEFLPEYSEINPVHPPRMYWRQPAALLELLRQDGGRTPVTRVLLEEHRNVILDVVTEYNRNLRADLIQMVFEDRLGNAKPISITQGKALEILKSASALFIKRDEYTGCPLSQLYTYDVVIEEIRRDFRHDELDVRDLYGGYDFSGWTCVLLEKLGLGGDVRWDVLEAKQAEKPLICLCGKPGFKQPALFIDLVSRCCTRGRGG